MIRTMSVAGSFYPKEKEELLRYIDHFRSLYRSKEKKATRVVIVPHAGYIFSGESASVAYECLAQSKIERLVVIGPSHKVAFKGWSMCDFDGYETPLGVIEASKKLYHQLSSQFLSHSFVEAHFEHSTETQFPFIKHYLDGVEIVEVVYGDADPKQLAKLIESALKDQQCGVVISSDLSHFYPLDVANRLDGICIEAIEQLNTQMLHQGCEACGKIGIEAIMMVASKYQLQPGILDYTTSAQTNGDKAQVVGYLSVALR